ncbi:hypothetical protein D3C77_373660 [compost metagenome]
MGIDGGLNLYWYAVNPVVWLDPLGLSCGSGAKKLADNLGFKPVGGGQYDAHHIVMSNSKDVRMIALRKQMDELGIDINSRKNGIWLPNIESARVPGTLTTPHKGAGVHGGAYKQHVYDTLSGRTTKKDFLSGLSELKEQLGSGKTFAVKR